MKVSSTRRPNNTIVPEKRYEKSASDRGVYKSRVIWTPMSKKRQQKTLSSLADSQRVALPGTVEYDEMRNRERGEGNMTFVYNENKVPLTSSQNASIFTSSTRLSLESFQVSEELFAMKQLMEKTKPFKKLRQSTATRNCRCPRRRCTSDLTRPLQNQREKQ